MAHEDYIKTLKSILAKDGSYQECIEIAINAIHLQKPAKVLFYNEKDDLICGVCPNCYSDAYGFPVKFCTECGQRLDWGKLKWFLLRG